MNKFSKETSMGILEPLEGERRDFDYFGDKSVDFDVRRGYRAKSTLSKGGRGSSIQNSVRNTSPDEDLNLNFTKINYLS